MEELSAAKAEDGLAERKRPRSDSAGDSDSDSLDAKRLRYRYDLLEILEDNDASATAAHDLDSVMRSFESEIAGPPPPPLDPSKAVVDLASDDSGESQPDLGYLLEASDDELGLPPASSSAASSSGEEEEVKNEINGLDEPHVSSGFEDHQIWNFEDEIPSCYEFGVGGGDGSVSDFVAVGGLFDFSDVSWQQPETLPAL